MLPVAKGLCKWPRCFQGQCPREGKSTRHATGWISLRNAQCWPRYPKVAGRCHQAQNMCRAQVASLLLCIAVMDLLVRVNTGCISPNELAYAMAKHYAAHVVAYGYTIFVPKHHFIMHLPRQLARFAFLIACFVHERKHNVAKRWPSRCALPSAWITIGLCLKCAHWLTCTR